MELPIFRSSLMVILSAGISLSASISSGMTLSFSPSHLVPGGSASVTWFWSSMYLKYKWSLRPFSLARWRNCLSHRSMKTRAIEPQSSNPIGPPSSCFLVLPENWYTWCFITATIISSSTLPKTFFFSSEVGSSFGGSNRLLTSWPFSSPFYSFHYFGSCNSDFSSSVAFLFPSTAKL